MAFGPTTTDYAASRSEVLAILGDAPLAAGLYHPSGLDWIPGFLPRAAMEFSATLDELATKEPEDIARAAGVAVCASPFPGYCGGSTARALHLPWHRERPERRLIATHELLHCAALRRGLTRCEADWWLATAALVHLAVRHGRALRFPTWFVGAIPAEIVALFG